MVCLIWTHGWVNDQDAGDLRRHHAPYDVTVMPTWWKFAVELMESHGIQCISSQVLAQFPRIFRLQLNKINCNQGPFDEMFIFFEINKNVINCTWALF